MKVIVGCERSQIVTKAFRKIGHEAYSCDILPCEGEWHFQEDLLKHLKNNSYDLGIFHPECTRLCSSGARWWKYYPEEQNKAIDFFLTLTECNIKKWCIENPIGIMSSKYRKPDQIIQPWQYGHGETKATCLWLKNLPLLRPTNIVLGRDQRIHKMALSDNRGWLRSITFQGIADAMADQWGKDEL